MEMPDRKRRFFWLLLALAAGCLLSVLNGCNKVRDIVSSVPSTTKTAPLPNQEPSLDLSGLGKRNSPSDFVHPLDEFPTARKDLPLPIQVLEQYISEHSVTSLTSNPDVLRRRFLVGMISCSDRTGNRIHEFVNALHWAILANRTFLWQYREDSDACPNNHHNESLIEMENSEPCNSTSVKTADICERILIRAPWIPMYDEWKDKLGLGEPKDMPFFEHPVAAENMNSNQKWRSKELIGDMDKRRRAPIVYFPMIQTQFSLFGNHQFRRRMLGTRRGKKRAIDLQSLGVNFLFGMLERYSFDLADSIKGQGLNAGGEKFDEAASLTIGLHSRHIHPKVDGCDVERELKCIDNVVSQLDSNRSVTVRLMADRRCTLDRLQEELGKREIRAEVATHQEGQKRKGEHGPFAGLGYYQDLSFVGQVRSAFVGVCRSSTHLVLERIEFNRRMELWALGQNISLVPDIPTCSIPSQTEATTGPPEDLSCA